MRIVLTFVAYKGNLQVYADEVESAGRRYASRRRLATLTDVLPGDSPVSRQDVFRLFRRLVEELEQRYPTATGGAGPASPGGS
jgi:hypothetical protein